MRASPNTVHLAPFLWHSVVVGTGGQGWRTGAGLPAGARITDYISLEEEPRISAQRDRRGSGEDQASQSAAARLPAQVVVYYVIALALYMQCSYREVLRCRGGYPMAAYPSVAIRVAGKSGISQARTRLGWEPMQQLHEELVVPVAISRTKGAWYGRWRLVSLDGSTLDVADEKLNEEALDAPERAAVPAPIRKFVSYRW